MKRETVIQWLSGLLQHKFLQDHYGIRVRDKDVLFKLMAAVAISGEIDYEHFRLKLAMGFKEERIQSFLETAKLKRIIEVEGNKLKAHPQLLHTIEREMLDAQRHVENLVKKIKV